MLVEADEGLRLYPDTPFEWMPRRAAAEAMLGRALLRQDIIEECIPQLKQALSGYENCPPHMDWLLPENNIIHGIHMDLGEAFQKVELWDQAREQYELALGKCEEVLAMHDCLLGLKVDTAEVLWRLASLPAEPGKDSQLPAYRSELLHRALKLMEGTNGKERLPAEPRREERDPLPPVRLSPPRVRGDLQFLSRGGGVTGALRGRDDWHGPAGSAGRPERPVRGGSGGDARP